MVMRIGIDLGGTKIEGVLLGARGEELERRRTATPAGRYDAIVRAVADLVRQLERGLPEPARVGIGTPGAEIPGSGLIHNANSVVLNGRPLRHDLEVLLGREIRLANDANCFAVSEASDGAAAGLGVVFGVILGTGVGGGVVVHGELLAGAAGLAGEWGHNPMPGTDSDPAPDCYCGQRGCIETYLSGPGLLADYRRGGGVRADSAQAVVAHAQSAEPRAEAALQRYEQRLARALAGVVNLLDPDAIVLGGGLGQVERWYRSVPPLLQRHVFGGICNTRLLAPRYGDASGVRGAARLWPAAP